MSVLRLFYKGKGVGIGGASSSGGVPSSAPSIYSQTQQQQQPSENGGLDYPKIHSSGNITPVSLPTSICTGGGGVGGGMDLSPSSKRIKGFSPTSTSGCIGIPQNIPIGMGHSSPLNSLSKKTFHSHANSGNSANHLQDFDPSHLIGGGHHPSSSSAAAVLIGKSLPIHCVIEVGDNNNRVVDRVTGKIETERGSNSNINTSGGGGGGSSGAGSLNGGAKVVEVDDFVIIPAGTPFQDVVTTVLTLLGYPKDTIQQAEGSILLRNWKPLKLDQVCDSPHKTVGDILNDLTNHATLRVLVRRPKGGTTEDLKEKLLRLLLAQSSNILVGSGCPLDEVTLSQLVKGHWPQNLAEDVKRRFDQWYSVHQQKLAATLEHHHPVISHSNISVHQIGGSNGNNGSSSSLSVTSPHQHSHLVNGSSGLSSSMAPSRHHLLDKSSFDEDTHSTNHPVFHGLATQKTRMRTSFDPEMELPRLQQWFIENPHPSRHQIQQYVRELNCLDCRKDRKPLDLNNVIYWFKNARAAAKRREHNIYSPSHSFYHHHLQSQNSHHHVGSVNGEEMGDNHISESRDGQHDYMNENSGSDLDDHDQDMKEYSSSERENMNGADREDNPEENEKNPKEKGNDECEKDENNKIMIKEEQDDDFISVDVELTEGVGGNLSPKSPGESCCNNNEPKDLSGKNQPRGESCGRGDEDEEERKSFSEDKKEVSNTQHHSSEQQHHHEGCIELASTHSTSPSVSPRSSPALSPNHPYDFAGAPSMVSRFHPFFDHPFMAYSHFNSFNFRQNFPGPNTPDGSSPSAYESALSMVGRKVLMPPGKPSPGTDVFHEFSNGTPMGPSRGDDRFSSRSASNAELISSIINSNRSELGLSPLNLGSRLPNPNSLPMDERRKRNRTFIDPITEVPRLTQWFNQNTHPSHNLIVKYTEELNRMPYRQKFPRLENKNVSFWFKNSRAKAKRLTSQKAQHLIS